MSKLKVGDIVPEHHQYQTGETVCEVEGDVYWVEEYPKAEGFYPYSMKDGSPVSDYPNGPSIPKDRKILTTSTGAKREDKTGKGDHVVVMCGFARTLSDLALHMENPYGRNWELGLPLSSFFNAAERHKQEFISGNGGPTAAISWVWNVCCFYETLHRIENGTLPKELDDIDRTQYSKIEYKGGE